MSLTALASVFVLALSGLDGADAHDSPPTEQLSAPAMLAAWDSATPLLRESYRKALLDRSGPVESLVIEALRSGTINERLLACAILERRTSPEAQAALRAAVDDGEPRVAAQAMLSLARFGDPTAADTVRVRLDTVTEPRLLKAALAALGELGDTQDIQRISAHLSDPDETVRVNAAAALARLGDGSGESILIEATESANPQARREATYALGFLESEESLGRLQAIESDPAGRWRTEAKRALGLRLLPVATSPKHATEVHGRGVLGDPDRSMSANAFALLNSSFYSPRDARDTARGTVDDDIGARPINHFYNPITGLNTMPGQRMDAVTRAERNWARAEFLWRRGWRNGPVGALHMLGRSLHLLQDMTSPAHVHDDPHVPGIDSDDFEVWGETQYPEPEEILPGLTPYVPEGEVTLPNGRTVAADSPAGLVHGMAMFTHELTAIPGEIVADGIQPDSELGRMFPDGRLYYQDAGILGANYWQIDEVGSYGLIEDNAWWPSAGAFVDEDSGNGAAQRITGRFYIENVSGDNGKLIPAVFERPLHHIADPSGMSFLEIYTGELYPEAVERSAAFLKAFEEQVDPTGGGCSAPTPSDSPLSSGDSLVMLATVMVLAIAGRRRQ